MQAYEFYATTENGVIPIPAQYRNRVTKNVRVILFEEHPSKLDVQLVEALEKTNAKEYTLDTDDNGNIIVDKVLHPELYDWAVNG